MKIITILCITLSIVLSLFALKVSIPTKGTSVIYSMPKKGDQPHTALISNLNAKQKKLLNFAYDVAKQDGYLHPQYLQGILMQESRGCNVKNFRVAGLTNKSNDRYFGCGQIKLAAAKAVLKKYPSMWKYLDTRTDEEIQARLILDDEFNIRISSKYCLMMGINEDANKAITAYNIGPGAVKHVADRENFAYTRGVKKFSIKIHQVKNIQDRHSILKSKNKQTQVLLARDP